MKISTYTLLCCSLLLLCCLPKANSQVSVKDSTFFTPMFQISIGGHRSAADLSQRFGNFASLGGGFGLKTKQNFLFTAEGYFQFGSQVTEPDVLAFMRNQSKQIINLAGRFAGVFYFQRGASFSLNVCKIIPVFTANPNSGLRISAGAGYWQHRIKITDKEGGVFLLRDEYLPGYDRKTGGLVLNQFIGYHLQSNNRVINFYAGLEFSQGFTRSLRDFNYDTRMADTRQRTDMAYGIRIGWIIPLYGKTVLEFYYY